MSASWGDPDWDEKTKHTFFAIKCFEFWGVKIGRIGGQIKEKWGEPRWYANIGYVDSIHDMYNVGYHYYQWSPEQGKIYMMLDFINNMSRFFFRLWPIRKLILYWQVLFYNVAYWIAMLRYPKQAHEIYDSSDWGKELIWFGAKFAYCKWWCPEDIDEH